MKPKLDGIAAFVIGSLFLGLLVPLSLGFSYLYLEERSRAESEITSFHQELMDSLSHSVRDALVYFEPNVAQNSARIVFFDPRVLEVAVHSSLFDMDLVRMVKNPVPERARPLALSVNMANKGENIGYVEIVINSNYFYGRMDADLARMILLFLAMFGGGLLLVIPVLHRVVLRPLWRLQAEAARFSTGDLATASEWKGRDELSHLGRTLEDMRGRLRAALDEKELILKEAHHRIKNYMGTMVSYLQLKSSYLSDAGAIQGLAEVEALVGGMMVLYDKLYRSTSTEALSLAEFLPTMMEESLAALGRRDAVALHFDLPDVELPAKTLTNIGIIMNELATNSVKYAFEGTKEPEISLSGRVAGGRLRLLYRDNGRGLPEGFDPAASTGLGMLLVQNIAKSYKGSVSIEGGPGAGFAIELSIEEAQAMTGRGRIGGEGPSS